MKFVWGLVGVIALIAWVNTLVTTEGLGAGDSTNYSSYRSDTSASTSFSGIETNGRTGNDSLSATSNRNGSLTYTNGRIGNDSLSATSNRNGSFTYTNGRIGNDSLSATSNQIGSFTFTNGRIGNDSFSCTSNQIGSFTYTNCP